MSARLDDNVIHLEGACPVEDAAIVLDLIRSAPGAAISLALCTRLHTAVAQVLLAAALPLKDNPSDPLLREWFAPLLAP